MIRVYIGGSFDPIHLGHETMAHYICKSLDDYQADYKIFLLPTAGSPFKNNTLDSYHRVNMLKLACSHSTFQLDGRELTKTPPVFSIDTFTEIRQQYPDDTLIFAMGLDSFESLPKWKQSSQLINLCHFWVFDRLDENKPNLYNRSSENVVNQLSKSLKLHASKNLQPLITSSNSYVFFDIRTPPAISSSSIRYMIRNQCHENDIKNLLSNEVWEYIKSNKLYLT